VNRSFPWVMAALVVGTGCPAKDDKDGEDAAAGVDGTWYGTCEGDIVFDYGTYSYSIPARFDLSLDLAEEAGDVTGEVTVTQVYLTSSATSSSTYTSGFRLEGTLAGDDLALTFVGPTSTTGTDYFTSGDIGLDLVVGGDALTGDLYVDGDTGGWSLPCDLAKQ
jgi:hypothetical protein